VLRQADLTAPDRLVTELVYVRRQRTLDALIDQLGKESPPTTPNLRIILHLGLYQLRYLSQFQLLQL